MAGPGTGKTHTLTRRIEGLCQELEKGQQVLAITFTHKAAREMQERLKTLLHDDLDRIYVGTFHSFCLKVLRHFRELAQLPDDFRILLPEETQNLAKELWPKLSSAERNHRLEEISRCKSDAEVFSHPQWLDHYNQHLKRRGCLDFDDLIALTVELMKHHSSARIELQRGLRHICVDEFQDINARQHELLKQLTSAEEKIFLTAIGDPNQAIYGFRGSRVIYFENFASDFAGAQILELSENYRSAQSLLKASTQVMAKDQRFGVPSVVAKMQAEGHLIIHAAATDKAEAEFVVHEIEKLVGGTSLFSLDSKRVDSAGEAEVGFADIAVLYRLNSQRFVLEEAFSRSGIPFFTSADQSREEWQDWKKPEQNSQKAESNNFETQKVSLLTLHAAKGLEFRVVFIIGCESNLLPLQMDQMMADPQEERRLFYVGMTRAKTKLYLTHAGRRQLYGQFRQQTPSPFINDIEEDLKAYHVSNQKSRPKKKQTQIGLFD